MQADAQPAGVFNVIWITVTMLVLLSNLVLIKKKHTAGLSISWNVLFCIQVLVVLLHVILVPSPQVTLPARALRDTASEVGVCPLPFYCAPICIYASYPPHPTQPHPPQPLPAIQFYEMAAKDKVCGNNLVALKDLDLGAWIDRPGDIDCEDQRWIGAPDPTDNLKHWSGFDPCADPGAWPPKGMYLTWSTDNYTFFVSLQCSCLNLIIYLLVIKDSCITEWKTAVHPAAVAAAVVATPEVALPLDYS